MGIVLRQFSREIWKTFGESAHERAEYLKDLHLGLVRKFTPTFHLDVGTQLGYNALAFGENASEIVAVDIQRFSENSILRNVNKAQPLVADALFLPFREGSFDAVSLISVIEHVVNQKQALEEAMRVLKSKGELIIQIPNKFFPIELHSGLPFVFLIPLRIRCAVLRRIGYEWLVKINVPSVKELKAISLQIEPKCEFQVRKVKYPSSIVWSKLRLFYKIAMKMGILGVVPLGYLLVTRKGDA
jgi:ubiquinone/menaquinone biosynthesis C-methylase UbiE